MGEAKRRKLYTATLDGKGLAAQVRADAKRSAMHGALKHMEKDPGKLWHASAPSIRGPQRLSPRSAKAPNAPRRSAPQWK